MIFTKNRLSKKDLENKVNGVRIFENLLACVVQAYFCSEYKLLDVMKKITIEDEDDEDEDFDPEEKQLKKSRKKWGKRKIRKLKLTIKKNKTKGKRKEQGTTSKIQKFSETDILNYLVSPLKKDLVFGLLIRSLEFERDCNF